VARCVLGPKLSALAVDQASNGSLGCILVLFLSGQREVGGDGRREALQTRRFSLMAGMPAMLVIHIRSQPAPVVILSNVRIVKKHIIQIAPWYL
jgi:hypothetical protein